MSAKGAWKKETKQESGNAYRKEEAKRESGNAFRKEDKRGVYKTSEKEQEREPGREGWKKPERGYEKVSRNHAGRNSERENRKEYGKASERESRKEFGRASERESWKEFGKASERENRKEFGKVPERGGQNEFGKASDKRNRKEPGNEYKKGAGREAQRGAGRDGRPGAETVRGRQGGGKEKMRLCPVSSKCGGCQWINIGYEEQLQAKAARFRRLMEPYCRPEQIIPMEQPAHYRNKVHAVFGEDRKHGIISGTYEERSHRIVPLDSCLIENQKADEIIVSIRGLLRSFKIRPYNEDTGIGLLRHVLIRVGHATGQIMVVLVLRYPVLPSKKNFVKALLKLHPEITTMVINVNDRDTSLVLGEKEEVIYGKGYIEDELCDMTFRISPRSFYQVNPVQTRKLYEKAMEYACLTGKETVLDAYCGTGTIGLIASRQAARVLGVELNKEAVRDAISNAKRNQVSNIRFYQRDAGEFLVEMAEAGEKLDVLLMDPPRSGSSEAFLKAAVKMKPCRIVYVSCNPETLVQDLKVLVKNGYKTEKCVAVDMFPYTEGIEAVVALAR